MEQNDTPQSERLLEVLEILETRIKRQNSLKYAFARGIVYGLGTVVGATVVVAILGSIVAKTFGPFTDIDAAALEQTIENNLAD